MFIFFVKKSKARVCITCLLFTLVFGCKKRVETQERSKNKAIEVIYKNDLKHCIDALDSLIQSEGKESGLKYYLKARQAFKQAEPVLAFVDKDNYKALNQPNILKVEEEDATDIKIKSPFGFQVLEEQLFHDEVSMFQVRTNAEVTKNRLNLILKNTFLTFKEHHIIWLIRDAIARVALTGVTGFDSPVLEQSLNEAQLVYGRLNDILEGYQLRFKDKVLYANWVKELQETQEDLNDSFNEFDRYNFIKNHTHKQLELLIETASDWEVRFPFALAFNNDALSLFSPSTFNMSFFTDVNLENEKAMGIASLGELLFNDNSLSLSGTMSCASCHNKDKAFSDGLKTFPKQQRNTPTLKYVALQQSFFYDGRAGSLEGQIVGVVNNENEFHTDLNAMTQAVEKDTAYQSRFNDLYNGEITDANIRHAIASYVRTMVSFNSKFDNNINGLENTLNDREIHGFNLFMGKAKCATCHFAPVFNGTVPPNFTESEFEAIGVPSNIENQLEISPDLGRYAVFNTLERKHFFKTPTIRNVSLTAPYMHNGIYNSLEEVVTFYNNGGGSGLGINLEHQTLPTDSLDLTSKEIEDVVLFMKTLEDKLL